MGPMDIVMLIMSWIWLLPLHVSTDSKTKWVRVLGAILTFPYFVLALPIIILSLIPIIVLSLIQLTIDA